MPADPQIGDVVVWHPDGEAISTPDVLRKMELRLDRETALPDFLADVRARTGAAVALLRLGESVVHVELLDATEGSFEWRDADIEVGGQSPWNKVGWLGAATELISDTLRREVGATVTEPVVQVKHWSISALLRVETDRGTFWFKQVPPFMAHEGRLIRWLAELVPGSVPDVSALGPDWMLTRAFAELAEGEEDGNPYATLAALQQAASSKASRLLVLGCPDRRLPSLGPELGALVGRSDLIDADLRQKLATALPDLSMCIEQIDDTMPASVVHGDLHGGNCTRNADGSWLIFDWTDGSLAHPFMDLGVLAGAEAPRREACRDEYLGVWRQFVDESTLKRTLAASEPVAAAFHALSYQRITDNVAPEDRKMWVGAVPFFLGKMFEALN